MGEARKILILCLFCCAVEGLFAASPSARDAQRVQFAKLDFTTDLYSLLRQDKSGEDLFFSPFSIAAALALVRAGSAGTTGQQIDQVLGLPGKLEDVHAAYNAVIGKLRANAGNVTLDMANRVFSDTRGFELKEAYNRTLTESYGTGIERLDFSKSEAARTRVNDWVEEVTRNKIQDLLPPGSITAATKLVLANAIYFKGDWAQKFDEATTRPADFHVSEIQTVRVDMMRITDDIDVADTNDAWVLDLPYQGNKLVMTLVVPKQMHGLSAIENKLQGAQLSEYLFGARRRSRKVQLMMPKFKIESSFTLRRFLSEMGMPAMFTPGVADLTGIAGKENQLFVDEGYHKAFVEVNEKGTEAAAATGFSIVLLSLPTRVEPPLQITLDHPFVFAITHRETAEALFFGRVSKPKSIN